MSEKKELLEQLSRIIEIFEKAYYFLRNDNFHYNKSMIEYYSQIKELNEELKNNNYSILLMQLANENYKEIIFKDLIQKINDFFDLAFDKKAYTIEKYLENCFQQIPKLVEINRKIDICKSDINDIKHNNSGMPKLERQKILEEFEEQLHSLEEQKKMIEEEFSWIKENHYFKILLEGDKIIEKIENYFNISIYKAKKSIFDSDLTNKLFKALFDNKVLKQKSKLTPEDFNLILNLKEPKQNQEESLKVSHFAYPFKLLSNEVHNKGFEDKEWEKHVVKQFRFNEVTLDRKTSYSTNREIYEDIICSNKVKNGK